VPIFEEINEEDFNLIQPELIFDSADLSGIRRLESINYEDHILLNEYSLNGNIIYQSIGSRTGLVSAVFDVATEKKYLRPYNFQQTEFFFITQAHLNCYMANLDLEDLKKWVREIHLALDAGKFAYDDSSEEVSRVANLGYYTERIARILGISVNSNGSIRSIRQSQRIVSGDQIPGGWNLGQWGRNNGGNTEGQTGGEPNEERDGLAWEIRSNNFANDDFTGETNAIEQGGFALVENLPQLLSIIFDDLDRAFDLQNMGANVLPTVNGEISGYTGLNVILLDILYSIGQLSRQTSGAHILAIKNQAILQELLAGLGLPIIVKELEIGTEQTQKGKLPYPGYAENAPTLQDLNATVLLNLAALIGAKVKPQEIEREENNN
jgi:hypothetical protein